MLKKHTNNLLNNQNYIIESKDTIVFFAVKSLFEREYFNISLKYNAFLLSLFLLVISVLFSIRFAGKEIIPILFITTIPTIVTFIWISAKEEGLLYGSYNNLYNIENNKYAFLFLCFIDYLFFVSSNPGLFIFLSFGLINIFITYSSIKVFSYIKTSFLLSNFSGYSIIFMKCCTPTIFLLKSIDIKYDGKKIGDYTNRLKSGYRIDFGNYFSIKFKK